MQINYNKTNQIKKTNRIYTFETITRSFDFFSVCKLLNKLASFSYTLSLKFCVSGQPALKFIFAPWSMFVEDGD